MKMKDWTSGATSPTNPTPPCSRTLLATAAVLLPLLSSVPARGDVQPLSDQELSAERGQGLLDITNSSFFNSADNSTLYTTRMSLGADVKLSANFTNVSLGNYLRGTYVATTDINIPLLQYGRSDAGDAKRLVQITNPYLEFVYRNVNNSANREIVGMRMGFEGISGDVAMVVTTLSGSVKMGSAPLLGALPNPLPAVDQTGVRVSLPQLGVVTAGDDSGPSRDFWVSVLKTPVQFQAPSGVTSFPAAQSGFWLNWRDRLVASLGLPPPNLPLSSGGK